MLLTAFPEPLVVLSMFGVFPAPQIGRRAATPYFLWDAMILPDSMLPLTYLFVPGDRPDRFAKAMESGADRVILDLEDAVRPEAKSGARDAIAKADLDWKRVVIRINPATSPFWKDDLELVGRAKASAIMIPKAEGIAELEPAADTVGENVEILPQIETARGLDQVDTILLSRGVRRIAFGHLDYALDIGAEPAWEALAHARQTLVWRSRVNGKAAPLDSVTPELDEERVKVDAASARKLGFGGKLLIHPRQITPTLSAFLPDEKQLDWAMRVMEAVYAGSRGALVIDGRMIDKPVEYAARRILSSARQT